MLVFPFKYEQGEPSAVTLRGASTAGNNQKGTLRNLKQTTEPGARNLQAETSVEPLMESGAGIYFCAVYKKKIVEVPAGSPRPWGVGRTIAMVRISGLVRS